MDKQNITDTVNGKKFVYKRDKANGVSMLIIEDNQERFYETLESIPKPDKVEFIESIFSVRLTHEELLNIAVGGIMAFAGNPWLDRRAMRIMQNIATEEYLPVVDEIMKKSAANLQDATKAMVYLMKPELPNIEELDIIVAELEKLKAENEYNSKLLSQPAPQQHKFYECPRPHYFNPRGYKNGFYTSVAHVRHR